MNLPEEAKNRGYNILSSLTVAQLAQVHVARMISKEFNVPFRKAYRWTAIGVWGVWLLGRNWNGGMIGIETYLNTTKQFQQDLKEASESDETP